MGKNERLAFLEAKLEERDKLISILEERLDVCERKLGGHNKDLKERLDEMEGRLAGHQHLFCEQYEKLRSESSKACKSANEAADRASRTASEACVSFTKRALVAIEMVNTHLAEVREYNAGVMKYNGDLKVPTS